MNRHSGGIVKGLLGANGFSVVFGDPGCGKTFFTMDLALHIALGWEWRERKVEPGPVIYIAAEGQSGIGNRIAAFKQTYGITECANFAVLPSQVDLASPKADTTNLINLINERSDQLSEPIKLLVVDTVSRVMNGADENSSTGMGAFIANVDRIREAKREVFGVQRWLVTKNWREDAIGAA